MTVGKVFLNYRRDDSEGYVGRLYDHLTQRFPGRIFRDVTGLRPGEDFVNALDREGVSCQVLLAIIGRRWLACVDAGGRRRLDDPEDILRREIIHALQRNVLVIPVLVGGATVPAIDDLPPELKPLGRRQALPISELDFERDLDRLIEVVAQELCVAPQAGRHAVPPPPPLPQPAAHKQKTWLWVMGGILATVVVLAIIGSISNQNKSAVAPGTTQDANTDRTESSASQPETSTATQQSAAPQSPPRVVAPPASAIVDSTPAPAVPTSTNTATSAAASAWQKELISTLVAMTSSRQQMSTILSSAPRSLPELQYQARQLLTAVDGYDQQVDNFSGLLSQGDSEGYFSTGTDRAQSAALQQVCQIRKQQAARYRYESQLVLQYNPYTTQYGVLLGQLGAVQGEINALDVRAAGLMQQAGLQ
jgi:hypothetical protein